jgi:hypothetical protein
LVTTPKTGDGSSNGTKKGTRKKEERASAPEIPGVPEKLFAAWLGVRKEKRAGPINETVIECLTREAGKAGLTVEAAVRYCCEAAWQNFNAGFYAKREGFAPPKPGSRNAGFENKNYREGVGADGSLI